MIALRESLKDDPVVKKQSMAFDNDCIKNKFMVFLMLSL